MPVLPSCMHNYCFGDGTPGGHTPTLYLAHSHTCCFSPQHRPSLAALSCRRALELAFLAFLCVTRAMVANINNIEADLFTSVCVSGCTPRAWPATERQRLQRANDLAQRNPGWLLKGPQPIYISL